MAIDPDRIFKDLSDDPHLASYELLRRIEESLGLKGTSSDESSYTEACGLLEAFYDAKNWKIPNPLSTGGFGLAAGLGKSETVEEVTAKSRAAAKLQYEAFVAQIMVNYRSVVKRNAAAALEGEVAKAPGYAVLEGEEKKEIHDHIEKIRSIIERSPLDDGKKNSLFGDSMISPARLIATEHELIASSHLQANWDFILVSLRKAPDLRSRRRKLFFGSSGERASATTELSCLAQTMCCYCQSLPLMRNRRGVKRAFRSLQAGRLLCELI